MGSIWLALTALYSTVYLLCLYKRFAALPYFLLIVIYFADQFGALSLPSTSFDVRLTDVVLLLAALTVYDEKHPFRQDV